MLTVLNGLVLKSESSFNIFLIIFKSVNQLYPCSIIRMFVISNLTLNDREFGYHDGLHTHVNLFLDAT